MIERRLLVLAAALAVGRSIAFGQITIEEINPTKSTLYPANANASGGGRVTKLAAATSSIFYAATEWGGLYKTVDTGVTWTRLDSHLPTAMWDVKVSPIIPSFLIATSFYDGKVNSLAGINVSTDAGLTWAHPPSAVPPVGLCPANVQTQPSAFGIAYDLQVPRSVYVGTNCGLAFSPDLGNNWQYIDPTPATPAGNIWSVVVHGGIIDLCGSDGHQRSLNRGATWQTAAPGGAPLPAGQCTIAASPDESNVLLASIGQAIYESDNGGGTWNAPLASPDTFGVAAPVPPRFPFVATNKPKPGNTFDLWFGDTSLYRATCTTPSPPGIGGAARCPNPAVTSWAGPFTTTVGGHADMADIAFSQPSAVPSAVCISTCNSDRTACDADCKDQRDACMADVGTSGGPLASRCAQQFVACKSRCKGKLTACLAKCKPGEICPVLMSSDGGVYRNTRKTGPLCQSPVWTQPTVTPRALWVFGMAGANRPGDREKEDLYFVNQDNGSFSTRTAGAAIPPWTNADVGDGFDVSASSKDVVYTLCCTTAAALPQIYRRNPGMSGLGLIPTAPPGNLGNFQFPDLLTRFSQTGYAVVTTLGVYATADITTTPITWTKLGVGPAGACAVQASGTAAALVFVVQAGTCTGSAADSVWTYPGAAAGGVWQQVNPPAAFGAGTGFGLLTVDPASPKRMFASVITPAGFQTARSVDGGTNWAPDAALDNLLTAGGAIQASPTLGPVNFSNFGTYAQPTLLAYDPQDRKTLLAGGADAGLFISRDNGSTWTTVTNNSGTSAQPNIPRPWFAYFNRECGESNIYIATQGRGVWRLRTDEGRNAAIGPCVQGCVAAVEPCRADCVAERNACLAAAAGAGPATHACTTAFLTCRSRCDGRASQCRKRCDLCPTSP